MSDQNLVNEITDYLEALYNAEQALRTLPDEPDAQARLRDINSVTDIYAGNYTHQARDELRRCVEEVLPVLRANANTQAVEVEVRACDRVLARWGRTG